MNLRAHGPLLIAGGIALAIAFAVLLLTGGCHASLPPEPGFVETVAASSRDR